jgi:alpha-galactosidase
MTPETKSILLNKEIIAVNQDTLGKQATCYRDNNDYQIWVKSLSNNEKAICLLNKSDEKKSVLVDFSLLAQIRTSGWGFGGFGEFGGTPATLDKFTVRDLWEHKDLVLKDTSMYIELAPHTVKVYRFVKK